MDNLKQWVDRISTPQQQLSNMPVCPYAKGTQYEIVETDGSNIEPPPWDFDLIIYRLPEHYTVDEVTDIANEYNNLYPEMVFLPDHKDRDTYINGIQTNNGQYNIILCQWRDNLETARTKLANTSYYSFWDTDYLKEILNT
jgi:hypothetical protein